MAFKTTGFMSSFDGNRTKSIRINTFFVLALKGLNLLAMYLAVPIQIAYLDPYNYGIWITVFSMLNWFQILDVGLGNGLRNRYAQCVANSDYTLAKYYVSTTYFLVSIISIVLKVLFFGIGAFVNWAFVFNVNASYEHTLYILLAVVFGSVILSFPLRLIVSLLTGAQRPGIANLFNPLANLVSLAIMYFVMSQRNSNNLLYIGFNYALIPVVILLSATIFFFRKDFKNIKPSLAFVRRKYIKDLTGLGVKFFILQINSIVLFFTDSFVIAHLLGQVKVAEYNVMFRLYSLPFVLFQIIATPYWSAFTHAYEKKDIPWIKKNIRNLTLMWGGIVLALVAIYLCNEIIFKFWIKGKVPVNQTTGLWFVFYFACYAAMILFVTFINGTGKITLQLYIACFDSLVNIPLCIYFTRNWNMGINGSLAAGIVCTLPFIILLPIQTRKLINGSAKSIWNS